MKLNLNNKIIIFTGFVIASALLFFIRDTSDKKVNQSIKFSQERGIGTEDNPYARIEFELLKTKNPLTDNIPYNIRQKELAFAKTLPVRMDRSRTIDWVRRGPYNVGGRTRALAIDKSDENVLIAGGVSGGMWRSEDSGGSWEMTTKPEDLHSVTAIAQDSREGHRSTWYYGTGERIGNSAEDASGLASYRGDGIFKSTDGGLNWSSISSTSSGTPEEDAEFDFIWTIKVDPTTGYVFVATYAGIFRSTTAEEVTDFENVLAPDDWNPNFTDIAISSTGVLYATLGSDGDGMPSKHGVWRSSDNGDNWHDITPDENDFPESYMRLVLDIAPSDDNSVYFIGNIASDEGPSNHFLWKFTSDGTDTGGSWENRSEFIPAISGLTGDFDSQAGYDLMIKVKPNNADIVFIGGTNLYFSTDGFSTSGNTKWIGGYSSANEGYDDYPNHAPDQHSLAFLPSDPGTVFSAHDGGISKTSDISEEPFVTWTKLNNGYYTTQFYHISVDPFGGDMLLGGLQDNGCYVTDQSSETAPWNLVTGGDGGFSVIKRSDPGDEILLVSTQKGNVNIIDEDNEIYCSLKPPDAEGMLFITPFVIDPNSTNTLFYAGGQVIWRNNNIDMSDENNYEENDEDECVATQWEELSSTNTNEEEESISALAVSESNLSHILYYGTSKGKVYKLTDANTSTSSPQNITGESFPENSYVSWISVNSSNSSEAMVTFSNYGVISVWQTSDAGENWTNISGNLEENPDGSGSGPSVRSSYIMSYEDETYYFLGTSIGVWSTDYLDGNSTEWELEGSSLMGNVVVSALAGRESDGLIVAATHGIGVYSTTLESWASIQSEAGLPEQFVLHQNYPNPFNPTTTIKYELFQSSRVTISVYDMLGRLVKALVNSMQEPGVRTIQWDATNEEGNRVSAGVYIFKLKAGNFIETKEMILLK
jgi:hypothetical protein